MDQDPKRTLIALWIFSAAAFFGLGGAVKGCVKDHAKLNKQHSAAKELNCYPVVQEYVCANQGEG